MSIAFFSNTPIQPSEHDTLIAEIETEYQRIDNDWLHMHFRIIVGLVVFTFLIECLMAFVLMNTEVVSTTLSRFILKFIVAPTGANVIFLIIVTFVVKSSRINQNVKIYSVSLLFVLITAVFFTAHNLFASSFIFFIFAVLLTTIYANRTLTATVSLAGLLLMTVSELFIVWDLDKVSVFDSAQRLGEFLIAIAVLAAIYAISLIEINYNRKKNEASILKELDRQILQKKILIDEMTGVLSRKALHDAMRDLAFRKSNDSLVFAIADIDHFKSINDNYGHRVGDIYLIEFANILKSICDKCSVYRYGGDEFCLLFKGYTIKHATEICKEIQNRMKKLVIPDYPKLKHTISFGLAVYSGIMTTAELFMNADQALYLAKEKRNDIKVY